MRRLKGGAADCSSEDARNCLKRAEAFLTVAELVLGERIETNADHHVVLPAPKVVRRVTTLCRPVVTRPRRIPVGSVGRVDQSRITRREGRQGDGDPGLARSAHEFRDAKPEPGQGPIEELAGRPACPRRLTAAIGCHLGDSAIRSLSRRLPLDLVLSYRYTYRSNAVVGPIIRISRAPGCRDPRIRGGFGLLFDPFRLIGRTAARPHRAGRCDSGGKRFCQAGSDWTDAGGYGCAHRRRRGCGCGRFVPRVDDRQSAWIYRGEPARVQLL
jgi:hypothetical protein